MTAALATSTTAPGDRALTDEELTFLALSADPDGAIEPDAVPLQDYLAGTEGLLPSWYMPAARGRVRQRWKVALLVVLIAIFLIIDAIGLCNTYGQIVVA